MDNSSGQSENWFLIAFGELTLPDARLAMSDWLSFTNHNSFSSYRLVFPTLKNDGDSMQIADVALYTGVGGGGSSIVVYDSALAIHMGSNESFSPAAEPASSAIDGDVNTKYLNYGRENSGFIVTPSRGPSIVTGFTMSTANDHEGRDPASWTLFGTNERIVTTNHGSGLDETWKEIASGTLALPSERFTTSGPTPLANTRSFSSYKFLVRTVKDGGENSMQLAEIQLDGEFVVPPLITAFVHHQIDNKFTLTWRSNASASYSIFFSTDLIQWKRNNVGSIAGATDGETTTFGPFAIARAQGQQFPQTVFFRVAND